MYSNESKGELMPAIAFYWPVNPDQPRDSADNADVGNIRLTFFARPTDIYPEYMPDPKILICPSDPDNDLRLSSNASCIAYTENFPCPGSGKLDGGVEVGNMEDVMESYLYLGWVFDKSDKTQSLSDSYNGNLSIEDIANIVRAAAGDDPVDLSAVIGATQFAQVFEHFLNDWVPGCLTLALTAQPIAAQDCANRASDRDWRPIVDPDDTNLSYGNGDTDTVFRLREGIERFLITDINNPGASAKAQSDIFLAYDFVSTLVEQFNHVPGGSNVLYLDGHVQFIRYPGVAPVNKSSAELTGSLTNAF